VVPTSPLSTLPPAVVRPFVPGKYLFPPAGFPPLYPVPGWAGVPCPGRVPIYSVHGYPLCVFSVVDSSLNFLDSGPTFNLTGGWSLFHGPVTPVDTPVAGVDSTSRLRDTGFGANSVVLGGKPITLRDSFFVPDLVHTLISIRGLVRSPGLVCTFTPEGVRLDSPKLSVPVWAPSSEGLYTLTAFTPSPLPLLIPPLGFYMDSRHHRPQVNTFVRDLSFSTVIHRRIGHISFGSRHIESTLKETYGSKFDRKATEFCTACVQAKIHQSRSGLPCVRKATRPLERVHFDISPSIPTMGIGRNVGFMFIVDECTEKVFIDFLCSKSEVGAKLKSFQRCRSVTFTRSWVSRWCHTHCRACARTMLWRTFVRRYVMGSMRMGSDTSSPLFTVNGRMGSRSDLSVFTGRAGRRCGRHLGLLRAIGLSPSVPLTMCMT
jgi:hypothetical protein